MSEDKNLNGIPDNEEVVVGVDPAAPGEDKTVVTPGEAEGSETSEAASEEVSSETVADEAPAESGSDEEDSSDEVVVEVEPLTVYLTFDEDADRVELEVTENFQLDLREVCNEQGKRFLEFEVEGDLDPTNLRLLMNALK